MIRVKNKPILAEVDSIVNELKFQLNARGINKFHTIKKGSGNIQVSCPNPDHKGGMEKKPSCGITTKDKIVNGKKVPAGTVNCFTCGYRATLPEMISLCLGYVDDEGKAGTNWLLKNFVSLELNDRPELEKLISRKIKGKTNGSCSYITEDELDKYRYIHPYMKKRKLTDEVIEKFDVGYDSNYRLKNNKGILLPPIKCLTFPVWDLDGNCVFVARRSVDTKFFHYPKDADKPVYGLNFITPDIKEVHICESIINALTLWGYGIPAVSLIGTGSEYQYGILKKHPTRKFILALDPDEAGERATLKLKKRLKNKIVTELVYPDNRDINELTKEETLALNQKY